MKTRTGFVSNSSSSSFCAFGVYVETEDLDFVSLAKFVKKNDPEAYVAVWTRNKKYYQDKPERLALIDAIINIDDPAIFDKKQERCCEHPEVDAKFCPECGAAMWQEVGLTEEDLAGWIRDYCDELLDVVGACHRREEYGLYIGRSYQSADKDTTFGEFWETTSQMLKSIGICKEPSHINEVICS